MAEFGMKFSCVYHLHRLANIIFLKPITGILQFCYILYKLFQVSDKMLLIEVSELPASDKVRRNMHHTCSMASP